ncbi:putative transglutaminase-like cysteine proteinase [Hoeflea marina]|uniref:Putative transglutaminase-like cysteine proteinase n=1 Tax=Hoeflea marina TaxID=274592 RepID=A0A317PWX1_9HYPH|nr:transglutaminase-like cysteine peptidase [Hoeflea marina]PWW03990.1 putative transglutaminase-like cysteine proteinase [Hoeflea marina]
MKKTNSILGTTAATLGLLITLSTGAQASANNLIAVGKTNPPIGHFEFCRSYPGECRALGPDRGPMKLTRQAWADLLAVNTQVNQAIRPDTDMDIYGVEELWTYPRSVGDCEDYVLLKRQILQQKGFDPANLLITVVLQQSGEGHAVLTVRTDYGDYVLDNMRGDVRLWADTGYTFIKRQSSENSAQWTKLGAGSATAVGTVK